MSTTLKIINGQLDIDASTGQVALVSGGTKCSQDLAEVLLQDYLADNDYGSYLKVITTNQLPFAGDLFIRYYISEAVHRLQSKQQDDSYITASEQITQISQLLVKTDHNSGTTVFFISVATADGGAESIAAAHAATQLNHQYERF